LIVQYIGVDTPHLENGIYYEVLRADPRGVFVMSEIIGGVWIHPKDYRVIKEK